MLGQLDRAHGDGHRFVLYGPKAEWRAGARHSRESMLLS
jgi:hypothetical protein